MNANIRTWRCNTDQHKDSPSDLLRLWADDSPASATPRRPRRRSPLSSTPGGAATDKASDLVLLLTITDAAKALGVGRSTIYELIGRGDLEVVHIGRSARVPLEAIRTLVRRLRAS